MIVEYSEISLKSMLSSILFSHAVHIKETSDNIKQLLRCINYNQHKWKLCGDLKVVGPLLGLQGRYTKYCCFLWEWNNWCRRSHCIKRNWSLRQSQEPERKIFSIHHESKKLLLLPFHIKLGFMKTFVKAMDKTKVAFRYVQSKWSKDKEKHLCWSSDS